MRRLIALGLLAALPSCSVFERIIGGLSDFVDDTEDGPRFVYAVAADDPVIRFAVLTPEDKGLVLASSGMDLPGAFVERVRLSPDARYGAVGYDLQFADVSDFGVQIYNARTGAREHAETDNTIGLGDELACRIPAFEALALPRAIDYVALAFPDETIRAEDIEVRIAIGDEGGNTLSFVRWGSDNALVATYDLMSGAEAVIAPLGITLAPEEWEPPRLTGPLVYRRTARGDWIADACPAALPGVLTPAPVRALTLAGGDILLDGTEIGAALGSGPMERGRVIALDGPH